MKIKRQVQALLSNLDTLELLKGSSTTFVLQVLGISCSYVFNLLLARMYGASVMGIFSLVATVGSVFMLFGLAGTETASVRFVAESISRGNPGGARHVYARIFLLVVALSLLAGIMLFFLSPYLAQAVFTKPQLIIPLQVTALTVPLACVVSLNSAFLRGLKRIRDSVAFQNLFVPAACALFLVAFSYLAARTYMTPIYARLVSFAVAAVCSSIVWRRRASNLGRERAGTHISFGEVLRVSLPMFFGSAMVFIMNWTDILMLGIFVTEQGVGIYKVALKMALLVSFNLLAVNSIAAPKFAELFYGGNEARLQHMAQFSTKLLFMTALPICGGLIAFAGPVMRIFGAEFASGGNVLIILCATQFGYAIAGSTGALLNMTGHQNVYRDIICSAALLNVVLNWILIQRYQVLGAAMATALSAILLNLAASIAIRKIFGYWLLYVPFLTRNRPHQTGAEC